MLRTRHDFVDVEAFDALYTGYTFFVRKLYHFDNRSKRTLETRQGHWFWSTIKLSKRIYRDALVAALFVNIFAIT